MDIGTARLSKRERWERILTRLNSDVTVRISALAEQFGVTTETIRRDIDSLTLQGLVSRTYGGAASKSLTAEPNLLQRRERHITERERIGRYAVSLVEPDDVLMIDAGSTTYQFARSLAAQPMGLTILTNCLPIAQVLGGISCFRVLLCPGDYSETENAVFGQDTVDFLGRFHANKALIGAGGIDEEGISDADAEACWIKRKMIACAERSLLLLDHSKFETRLFDRVCDLDAVSDLIVDRNPGRQIRRTLSRLPTRLHIAD